ncbi:MAG TPA: cellulose binding domain-containing protein [Cellvibrio sp.]|nr:cellulose binding domain-containing protein [Cellvibrio sp.]
MGKFKNKSSWLTESLKGLDSMQKPLVIGFCAVLAICAVTQTQAAPRQAEYLDRGVVALPSGNGIFISWRFLGNDPDNISFNVYRNGTKVNSSPITNSSNFFDGSGSVSAAYTVRPIVNGKELNANAANPTWSNPYWVINLNRPNGGSDYTYSPGDASVGDVDGDGEYEVILKWDPSNLKDNSHAGATGNVYIDAYKLNGTRLWRVDLGRNIRAGAHYTQFMVYDLDGDGKAEVAAKTAPGTRDGIGNMLGGSNANTDYRNGSGYILSGPEYLTIFNGETGAAMATTDYVPARGNVSSWGDNYGNRVDRFLAGIAYVDGQRPSLIMARGYYTRAVVVAWDWRDGKLTRRWTFDSNTSGNSRAAGQGAHSLTIGDVDQDGKDEIVYGAATINDNGTLMYSTGFGHGDALHLSDFLPGRPGLEVFMVHEHNATGIDMHDARTGQVIWSVPSGGADVGRGVIMDIDPRHPGAEGWASVGGLNTATGQQIGTRPNSMNFAAWWDGDLLREFLNNNIIDKWNYNNSTTSRLLSAGNYGAASNNGTKSTPSLSGDIFGDWREEVIWRNSNNTQLMIFTTTTPTTHKLRTLMHDIQYREAIAWQNTAYNQPPHPSFFIGDGMAKPPAPDLYFVGKNPNDSEPVSNASSSSKSSATTSTRSSSSVPVSSSSSSKSSSLAATSSLRSSVASSVTPTTGNCAYVITNNWGNGFTGAIRITNKSSTAINGWNVNWSYAGSTRLSGTWNTEFSGTNPYSASNLSWNAVIQPGQTVEFGFQGTYSGAVETPIVSGSVCR